MAAIPEDIFVFGHKRPDTDSIVSAVVLADLRNRLNPGQRHQALAQGEANAQTTWLFERARRELPPVRTDLRHTVGELMRPGAVTAHPGMSMGEALRLMQSRNLSMLPVVDPEGVVVGLVSDRLPQSRYFYHFNVEDYLGQLLTLEDVVETFEMTPLQDGPVPSTPPGCSFFLASLEPAAMDGKIRPGDVVLCGPWPAAVSAAARSGAIGVIIADSTMEEAREAARGCGSLPAYHTASSLMAMVAELPKAIRIGHAMATEFPSLRPEQTVEDVLTVVSKTAFALPVIDASGRLLGVFSRTEALLEQPRPVILVDHFEKNQSIKGLERARVLEIVDHHRVGNIETPEPARVDCRPLGSTASIIALQFREQGLTPDRSQALLLLGAMVADTLLLTSPTTTETDRTLADGLAQIAGVDMRAFGLEVLSRNDELLTLAPGQLVDKDLKEFSDGRLVFALGQIETVDAGGLGAGRQAALQEALEEARRRLDAAFAGLMVTDVFRGATVLLVADPDADRRRLLLGGSDAREFPGVVSRKKQMLPWLLQELAGWKE